VIHIEILLGQIKATKSVYDMMLDNREFKAFIFTCLNRHVRGDWGDISSDEKLANDQGLKTGNRLQSTYNDQRFPGHGDATIRIITEADRSSTTILFPDE
jgi:hypothetical protein